MTILPVGPAQGTFVRQTRWERARRDEATLNETALLRGFYAGCFVGVDAGCGADGVEDTFFVVDAGGPSPIVFVDEDHGGCVVERSTADEVSGCKGASVKGADTTRSTSAPSPHTGQRHEGGGPRR